MLSWEQHHVYQNWHKLEKQKHKKKTKKIARPQVNATVQSLYTGMFGSIGMDHVISESCYKGAILK